jgi:hypothetical protein
MTRSLICLFFLTAFALAQPPAGKGKAAPVQAGPVLTDELTAYLLPDDLKLKNRDLQLEWAEREAANQTMLVTIEKNKARQTEITLAIQKIWLDYAASKQIDLKVWEPEPKDLKFVKKKASIK